MLGVGAGCHEFRRLLVIDRLIEKNLLQILMDCLEHEVLLCRPAMANSENKSGFRPPRPKPKRAVLPPGALVLPPRLIQSWEDTLIKVARLAREFKPGEKTKAEILEHVLRNERAGALDLWHTFTTDREDLRRGLLSHKRTAVAYLLGFHLPNVARMSLILQRLKERQPDVWQPLLTASFEKPVVWLDLGCGTGAMSQAAMTHVSGLGWQKQATKWHLYDANGVLLDVARTLFENMPGAEPITTHRVPIEQLDTARLLQGERRATVYMLGYVWNELARNPKASRRLMQLFAGHIERGELAMIVMLDPANEGICRDSMQWREEMWTAGFKPLYPCPKALPCPMLERARDWCYSEGHWSKPKIMQRLDDYMELDRAAMAASAYVMVTPAWQDQLAAQAPSSVVVGRPREERGFSYLLCQGDKLTKHSAMPGEAILARGVTAPMRTSNTLQAVQPKPSKLRGNSAKPARKSKPPSASRQKR